jgi:hypothetical protein
MRHFRFGKGSRVVAALAASTAAVAFGGLVGTTGAHADPAWGPQANPLVAVGSNTIEDLMNAASGLAPSAGQASTTDGTVTFHSYSPLQDTTAPAGQTATFEQVYSWDAINPYTATVGDCISPKPGGAPIARPNGSTDGYKAISAAIAKQPWNKTTSAGCAAQAPNGEIDLGRSSGGPPTGSNTLAACSPLGVNPPTNCLAWIDFARDGVAYAYFINPNPPTGVTMPTPAQVNHLDLSTLVNIYSNANTLGTYTSTNTSDGSNGVTFAACFPQTGSGTAGYWAQNILGFSSNATPLAAATAAHCFNIEENGGNVFQTTAASAITADAGEAAPPQVVIIPFSVGSWVAQGNNVAFNRSGTGLTNGVQLGCPGSGGVDTTCAGNATNPGLPYTLTGTTYAPYTPFYTTAPYGRELWLDVNNASLNGPGTTVNLVMRRMLGFIGTNYNGANDGATGTVNVSNTNTGTGQLCKAPFTSTITTFGFIAPQSAPAGSCGNETLTVIYPGPYTGG